MKKKTLKQVPLEVSVHLWYLHQDKGIKGKELLNMYPKLSKATIYQHAKKPVAEKTVDKRKHNHGRPRKISPQDKRLILHQMLILREQCGSFTIKRLRVSAGARKDVSDEQWDVYYVVVAIDFYIPGRRVCWKRMILKRDANLPVNLSKCWLINSGKKVFLSTLMLLIFSISTTLTNHKYNPYEPWHDN